MVSTKFHTIHTMSLITRLWLSIFLIMLLAFGTSFLIGAISGKKYLETQLQTKNIDNATSLALSMSQLPKEPVNIELLISAQFDSGHYQLIRLSGLNGRVIAERKSDSSKPNVPQWFIKLITLNVQPGYAQVQDGWSQYGQLRLESDARFAYEELWRGSRKLLLMSLVVGLISGILGSQALRIIMRPLKNIVYQANAIGERRFITIKEPETPEFKALARAMNRLSHRIKKMLEEESLRLEQLRREANYDPTSGLLNRSNFISTVNGYASNDEIFSEGVLVITRLASLAETNQRLGHTETDALIKRLGIALEGLCRDSQHLIAGRITGADFAVFSSEKTDGYSLASQIKSLLYKAAVLPGRSEELWPDFAISAVVCGFRKSDSVERLHKVLDHVLGKDLSGDIDHIHVLGEENITSQQNTDEKEWRSLLTNALDAKRLKLAFYPVIAMDGKAIHRESPVRLQLKENEAWIPAGEFIAWANRLDLVSRLDEMVIEKAIDELNNGGSDVGVNISSRDICDPQFIKKLIRLVKSNPGCADKLWLEVPEQGVFEHFGDFRSFCNAIKPLGCKVGIEHVGTHVSRLGELHDLGLDYIKIDVSIIRDIDKNTGNKAFLRGLCLIAHSIGLLAIAEGVQTAAEIECLPELGLDGMTGPGVKSID